MPELFLILAFWLCIAWGFVLESAESAIRWKAGL